MSKLQALLAKPKEITLAGEQIMVKPLTVDNIDLVMDLENESKRANALKKIIKITLKEAFTDATEEELNGVSIQHFQDITKAIMEVNGLGQDENKPTSE